MKKHASCNSFTLIAREAELVDTNARHARAIGRIISDFIEGRVTVECGAPLTAVDVDHLTSSLALVDRLLDEIRESADRVITITNSHELPPLAAVAPEIDARRSARA